ncbi:MAG: hypothetical protein NC402_03765 [Prevotella sp.]|nr:hypothetical protein [Prevotella sp.]MCM1074899.1 hypothetical protein [Ruminococcus sp.]
MNTLQQAQNAWLALAPMRRQRARLKAFTYGRQWGDSCRSSDGRILSEEQRMVEEGRLPVTNNIIRRMIKAVIGRYRHMCARSPDTSFVRNEPAVSETDARALEEFLISGRAVQRLNPDSPVNVSPDSFFYTPFFRSDASDCRLMGMLHDMSLADVINRFGTDNPRQVSTLKQMLKRGASQAAPWPVAAISEFATPAVPGTYRIIELWSLSSCEYLDVTDPVAARSFTDSIDALPRLEGLNKARAEIGSDPLIVKHRVCERWINSWLTPAGEIINSRICPEGSLPPFAICFYPLIDGEVHSLVEDVIDQQKYINRLISLLDHIISSSAKGVLLYPADQLPEGFSWKDIRRIWANPNGILPFKRTAKSMVPQQVTSSGAAGNEATRMLQLQLSLFDEISGATGALTGKSSSAQGEGMLKTELENALISMLDILSSFRAFIIRRDRTLKKYAKCNTPSTP